jgi:hypothetical protein
MVSAVAGAAPSPAGAGAAGAQATSAKPTADIADMRSNSLRVNVWLVTGSLLVNMVVFPWYLYLKHWNGK